jgi:pyrimidine-specific ribonucleoside hydrolase
VVENTAKVLDAAGAPDLPIAAGATKPLIERMRPEGSFHVEDGLGGIVLPATARATHEQPAVQMLHERIARAGERVALVSLAPMTNAAARC